jgi:hypothetical protein
MPIAATAIKAKIVLRNMVLSSLFPCTPHNLSAGKTLPIRQKKPAGREPATSPLLVPDAPDSPSDFSTFATGSGGSLRNRLAASTETRLPVVTGVTANLIAQLSKLNELREKVRKAQLSAEKSQRTNHQKRTGI